MKKDLPIYIWCFMAVLVGIGCFFITPMFWKVVVIAFTCFNLPTGAALLWMMYKEKKEQKNVQLPSDNQTAS